MHRNLHPLAAGMTLWVAFATGACSSSDKAPDPAAPGAPGTMTPGTTAPVTPGTVSMTPGVCAAPTLEIAFSPMFSAFDGVHTFQIPAVADGVAANVVAWSADPTMVNLQPDPNTGGVLIQTKKAGVVDIVATAGGLCGVSKLTIAAATPEDWEVGNQRYNNGIVLRGIPRGNGRDGGGPPNDNPDASSAREAACTNCHGPTANGPYKTVAHSPQQAGGFSDTDLVGIVTKGTVPEGGYFDATIVSYQNWQSFHRWEMSPEEAKGIIVYLRSLTPQEQKGAANFGGRGRGDGGFGGGFRDGGFGDGGRRRDGGGNGNGNGDPADAGAID